MIMDYEIDEVMRQWIAIQRAGTGVTIELTELIAAMYDDLYRAVRAVPPGQSPQAAINRVIRANKQIINSEMQAQMVSLANIVARREEATVGVKAKEISATKVKGWVNKTLMAGTQNTVGDLIDMTVEAARRTTKNAVLLNDSEGVSVRATLMAQKESAIRKVETVSRSMVNQVANESKDTVYMGTKEIDRYMWVSTLDHRTSDFCMAADQKVFKTNEGNPVPPAHPNCRSVIMGIEVGKPISEVVKEMEPRASVTAKSKDQLEKQTLNTRTGRVRKPSRSDISPLKGQRTYSTNYDDWLSKQPKYYQEAILGKSATAKYRNGEPLTKILSDRSSSIDFKQLNEALN